MTDRSIQAGEPLAIESLRRRYLEWGEVPDRGVAMPVLRSWERCLRLGLDLGERARPSNTTRGDLMVARERNAELLNHAGGVMEHVYEQIRASGSMVLFADASGLILHGIGDPAFVDRASRVALQPGASWSECQRGTNAIGATLIERAPRRIRRARRAHASRSRRSPPAMRGCSSPSTAAPRSSAATSRC